MQARDASTALKVIKDKVQEGDRQAAQYLLTYATKGEAAGIKAAKITKTQARRGAQARSNVVDLDRAFDRLQQDS